VAALVADTDRGEALPLLAFILRQLAGGLPAGGTLSLSHYYDLGGVHGALTRHADTALVDAVRVSGLTEREVLTGLTRLVTVDETGRRARRRIQLNSLPEPLRVALQIFVERRLLLTNTGDEGQVWLTVAHEALLSGWRPLDTTIGDVTVALRAARAVEQAAADWDSAGRPEHYLWEGERLTTTLTTLGMTGDGGSRDGGRPPIVELDYQAREFLDATARRVQRIQRRQRRRRTRTITVLSILLAFALITAGLAVWQQHRAHRVPNTLPSPVAWWLRLTGSVTVIPEGLCNSASLLDTSIAVRKSKPASERPLAPPPTSGLSAATPTWYIEWRLPPTGAPWPPPAPIAPFGCGMSATGTDPNL
jgi:hypothetical protein